MPIIRRALPRAAWHSNRCPGEETLGAFVDRRLSAEMRRDVETHLAACGFCRWLVATTAALPAQPGPQQS
jgi:anti-sigma factor RsiW